MKVAEKYVDAHIELNELERKLADVKAKANYYWKLNRNNVLYSGTKDYGESWTNWWVFDGCLTDEQLHEKMVELGISTNLDRGIYDDNDWDCSGLSLSHAPIINRTKTRILVTQDGFIDC